MEKKAASRIMLTLILISMLTLTFNFRPAKAESLYSCSITITPTLPTIDDEVKVTVGFELASISIDAEFGPLRQIDNEFFVDIDIRIPAFLLWVIGHAGKTYSLGKLPEGSYTFNAIVREWRQQPDGSWLPFPFVYWHSKSFTVVSIAVATVDIDPDTLNLRSKGQWITAYLELPTGYDVNNIDVSTIRLNDIFSVDSTAPAQIGDYDMDGISDLMVKFNRTRLESYIYNVLSKKYGEATLTITGQLYDGTPLKGSDTIFVNYAGDANNDGTINILDAALISAHWYPGPPIGPLGYDPNADFNLDLRVNIADVGILSVNWGQTIPYTIP